MGAAKPLTRDVDQQIRSIIDKVKGGTVQTDEALEQITLKLADRAELDEVKEAVRQLEQDREDLRKDLQEQIKRHRTLKLHDPNYRGMLPSAYEARKIGLYAMAAFGKGEQKEAALKALESAYPDVYAHAMGTVAGAAGSATVLSELSDTLITLFEQYGAFEGNANTLAMGAGETTLLVQDAGITVYLVSEGTPPTGSDASVKPVTLIPKEWGALTYVGRTLLEDAAVDIGEMIVRDYVRAFAYKLDYCGFVGDGSATSFGISGVTKRLVDVNGVDDGGGLTLAAGNAYSEITLANLDAVMGGLPLYAGVNPRWYCSRNFFFNVMVKLMHAAGGLTAGEIEGRRRLLFGGDPVVIAQVMPKTEANSQVCCLYGDLSMAAAVGRRREFRMETSSEYKFAERQLTLLGTRRVAIDVHSVGTATASGPIRGLITAAS